MAIRETREEIVAHAVRWANNMLVEVIGNHASVLGEAQRECLMRATTALSDFQKTSKEAPQAVPWATARARRERYVFDRNTDPWGRKTVRTWDAEVTLTVGSSPGTVPQHTFGITSGGVTGHERVFLTDDFVTMSCKNGWWACAGTPERWDGLFIPADEMRKAFDTLGVLRTMGDLPSGS